MGIQLKPIASYRTGVFDEGAAEIVAHDPATQRLFITNGFDKTVDVVSITDPSNPAKLFTLEFPPSFDGLAPTSAAVNDGIVAVAVPADPETDPGHVLFFDTSGKFENSIEVGAQPDMLTFTPDGQKILVANEGNLDDDIDPDGSIGIIDISSGVGSATLATAGFTAFNGQEDALRALGVRIFDGKTVAQDVEPEFIAVTADGATAVATLQENNALAVIDIPTATVSGILPLGAKDHGAAGTGLDANDSDDAINIQNWPVLGMYQPDGIARYDVGGQTYYITANEGDERDEDARVKDLDLDPVAFPDADEMQSEENLGRLDVSTIDGDLDGDGDFDQLFSFGARSFSIWDAFGNQVFDSGDQLEQITATVFPDYFNTDADENTFDSHSDAQGPKPEGVTVGQVNGETYAFIGLEDIGGVMIYNVTDPTAPTFESYRNDRDFSVEPGDGDVSDLAPEGVTFIAASDSPIGKPMLAVANELSGSTTLYEIENPGVEKSGTEGDDPLDGTSGDDTLSGLDGNDTVNGLGGDDVLYGDAAADCVEISLIPNESAYQSTCGWYNTETLEGGLIVANGDWETNVGLERIVIPLYDLTADEIQNLGFFIIADGYNQNGDPGEPFGRATGGAVYPDLRVFETNGIWQVRDADTSYVFEGLGAPAYFTEADKNPAGNGHVMVVGNTATDYYVTLSWEDLPGLGDQDFNDLVMELYLGCGARDPSRSGDDSLIGGAGNDTQTGGWGTDTFHFEGTDFGQDTITDFEDFELIKDTLSFEGVGSADDHDDFTYAVGDFDTDGAQDDIRITFAGLGDDLADERIDVLGVGSDIEALKANMLFV